MADQEGIYREVRSIHEAIWRLKERARRLAEGPITVPEVIKDEIADVIAELGAGFGAEIETCERIFEADRKIRHGEV